MTEEPSSQKLARALSEIPGVPPAMIDRALDGYFGDYTSPLAMPLLALVAELRDMAALPTTGPRARAQFLAMIGRVKAGEFDGTKAEAQAWAASEEGRETFAALVGDTTGKLGDVLDDSRPHYAAKVTDLPPRSIACRCGRVFDGDDPIGEIAAHMESENPK